MRPSFDSVRMYAVFQLRARKWFAVQWPA